MKATRISWGSEDVAYGYPVKRFFHAAIIMHDKAAILINLAALAEALVLLPKAH